jgi:hypothetical protein
VLLGVRDPLKDVEQLSLGDLAIGVDVDLLAELLDLFVGHFAIILEFPVGIVDEGLHLCEVQGLAFVLVVQGEHTVDGVT